MALRFVLSVNKVMRLQPAFRAPLM